MSQNVFLITTELKLSGVVDWLKFKIYVACLLPQINTKKPLYTPQRKKEDKNSLYKLGSNA